MEKLKKAVPQIQEDDIKLMKRVPFRSYDESIVQEQLVYRLKEVGPTYSSTHPTEALDDVVPEGFVALKDTRNATISDANKFVCIVISHASSLQAVLHNGESIHAICAEVSSFEAIILTASLSAFFYQENLRSAYTACASA